jgi:amidase
MNDLLALPLRDLVRRMANRDVKAAAVVRALIGRIEADESRVRAWQFFDPALALRQARQLDAGAIQGALHGVPIGVKDLMDTADMPTGYGSTIYAGHRPTTDAAVVAASRAQGAIVMGKTVTTEFATYRPGPTANPRTAPGSIPGSTPGALRTPGGSSSGSAAAVAAGMVPLAFGTQTAGSIIRPAAYCGIVGYKPTHGTLPSSGVKALSPSLDTVGVLARSVDDAAFFVGALARLPLSDHPDPSANGRIRVGICRTPHWDRASLDTQAALARAARLLEQGGALLQDLPAADPASAPVSTQDWMHGLTQAQTDIMAYEANAAFAAERLSCQDGLSDAFKTLLASGQAIDGQQFFAAQQRAASARHAFDALFDHAIDIVLAPSTEGEAPLGLEQTGDPIFNRMWTLLGNPCVHVPLGIGSNGMPIGITVIGPRWGDAQTLAIARALERAHAA